MPSAAGTLSESAAYRAEEGKPQVLHTGCGEIRGMDAHSLLQVVEVRAWGVGSVAAQGIELLGGGCWAGKPVAGLLLGRDR